ncbi:MAG: FIST C-terminal domain-containing protein [Hyphomicrobiales bacterium]|nr:FIST C-terminal domain-containing protein [Hyphomicrobiales bacterium]
MTDFALAHAADAEPRALAETCAAQLSHVDGHTLGFLYVTDPLAGALGEVAEILRTATGVPDWVGTVGLGVCATGTEYFGRPAITALTGRFAQGAYRITGSLTDPDEIAAPADAGFVAGLGVVHGDPRNTHTPDIVAALAHEKGTYLVGGLSAAESAFPQLAGRTTEGGVSGVLLGGALNVAVGLTQGCSPIGPTHRISRGESNVLVRLDDRPALEVLCEDLGVADGVDPRPWLGNIHAALPVAGSDTGDYLVRNLIGIEPSQGLVVIAEEIRAGARLMFVRRDEESASKDLRRMLDDLQSRTQSPPKAGLYFSCVARGPNLFEGEAHELGAIRDSFGEIPVVGFFGNGEISHDRVYGYTGVLTLFL